MRILICSVGFGSIITILHSNYYKIYRKQKKYLLWAVTALITSACLNILAVRIWGTLTSIAGATVLSFRLWYVINDIELRRIIRIDWKQDLKDLVGILCYLSAFWLSFLLAQRIFQIIVYILAFLFLTFVFLDTM